MSDTGMGWKEENGRKDGKKQEHVMLICNSLKGVAGVLAVTSLSLSSNDEFLDLCAGNGYHTIMAGLSMSNKGVIVCNSITQDNIHALQTSISRLGLSCIITTKLHLLPLHESFQGRFSHVLVTPPCRVRCECAAKLDCECAGVDKESCLWLLLQFVTAGIDALRNGGVLVYLTPSGRVEDNEEVIEHLRMSRQVEVLPIGRLPEGFDASPAKIRYSISEDGFMRITQGDFKETACIVKLRKVA